MKLVAVGLALGIAVGDLLSGRLSQLSDLKPRYAPSALIGLLLVPSPEVPGVQV